MTATPGPEPASPDTDDRAVRSSIWVENYPTGRAIPHLLMHPAGDRRASAMGALSEHLGLARADQATGLVFTAPGVLLELTDDQARLRVPRPGDADLVLDRPIAPEWAMAARTTGWVQVSVGADGFHFSTDPAGLAALDRYRGRRDRMWLGRVLVQRPDPSVDQ